MKTVSSVVEHTSFVPANDLERLLLKIARRADDISRETGLDPTNALENWRIAEREVLGAAGLEAEFRGVRRTLLSALEMWDGNIPVEMKQPRA